MILAVADAVRPVPISVSQELPLNELIERFAQDNVEALPVVDENGVYRGTVTSHEVEKAVRDKALDTTAGDPAPRIPTLSPNQNLERALGLLVHVERHGLPVLTADNQSIDGRLTHRDVLRAYNARLEQSLGAAERQKRPAIQADAASASSMGLPKSADGSASVLGRLRDYRIIDLEISHDRPPAGQYAKDVAWPPSTFVVAIRRGADAFTPNGMTMLRRGDRRTVPAPVKFADNLSETLSATTKTDHATAVQ